MMAGGVWAHREVDKNLTMPIFIREDKEDLLKKRAFIAPDSKLKKELDARAKIFEPYLKDDGVPNARRLRQYTSDKTKGRGIYITVNDLKRLKHDLEQEKPGSLSKELLGNNFQRFVDNALSSRRNANKPVEKVPPVPKLSKPRDIKPESPSEDITTPNGSTIKIDG